MPPLVIAGATCACSFGTTPTPLVVPPAGMIPPAASVADNEPITNIVPFGMCTTPSNPMVAAATTAALGVLTPVPCVPLVPAQWTPGAMKVQIRGVAALHSGCTAMCMWGGMISITNPGQFVIQVL